MKLVRAILLGAMVATLALPGGSAAADARPDIVVVMADDLGAIDERVLSRLPAIRELWLDGGRRFDRAYAETPLCCPGRASFLTGQHTRRHRVTRNLASLLDPSSTIATALHGAGYQTAQIGKYLNNLGTIDTTPPGWDYNAMLVSSTASESSWYVQGAPQTGGYMDRVTGDLSESWVSGADRDRPLFLWASPRAPHWAGDSSKPWIPAIESRYRDAGGALCNGIEPWRPPDYAWPVKPLGWPLGQTCRSLLTVDDMVSDLRAAIDARGRPTVWVFTSDNGMAWGRKGFPLKNTPWAGRTPLYFAGTNVVKGVARGLVSNIDLGPTLAELGGTTMPNADGVSYASLLTGDGAARQWMLEDHPLGGSTRGPWRGPFWGVRTRDWHLLAIKDRPYELYDLNADPWETRDVAALYPNKVAQLARRAVGLIPESRLRR